MSEFATTASLAVSVEQSSLQSARRTIENSLGDITVDVTTPTPDGGAVSQSLGSVDTGPSITGGTTASEPETTVPILTEQLEVEEAMYQELQDLGDSGGLFSGTGSGEGGLWDLILDTAGEAGDVGGGAALTGAAAALSGSATSLTGSAAALTGAAAALSLSGSGSVTVKNTPLPVEDVDDIGVVEPEWVPLDVSMPRWVPLDIKHPDWVPLEIARPSWKVQVADPSPLTVSDPSPLSVSDPSPLSVADPSPLEVEDVVLPVEDKIFHVEPIGGLGGASDVTLTPPQVRGPGLEESMIEGGGKGMAVGASAGIAAGFAGGPLAPVSVPAGAIAGGLIGGAGGAALGGLNYADRFVEAQQRNTTGTIRPRRATSPPAGPKTMAVDSDISIQSTNEIQIDPQGFRRLREDIIDEVRDEHRQEIRELRSELERMKRSLGGGGGRIR